MKDSASVDEQDLEARLHYVQNVNCAEGQA